MESYLSVVVRDRHGATVLSVRGELDMASSPKLCEALGGLDPGARGRTILDLAELEFIDLAGLRVLLVAQERIERAGGELVLRNARPGVRRLLTLAGAAELLRAAEEEDQLWRAVGGSTRPASA